MGAYGQVEPALVLFLFTIMCYLAGRFHQWARSTMERDQAFREGYDTATRSLFALASRVTSRLSAAGTVSQTREMPQVPETPMPPIAPKVRPSPRPPYAVPPLSPEQVIARRASRRGKGARHAA